MIQSWLRFWPARACAGEQPEHKYSEQSALIPFSMLYQGNRWRLHDSNVLVLSAYPRLAHHHAIHFVSLYICQDWIWLTCSHLDLAIRPTMSARWTSPAKIIPAAKKAFHVFTASATRFRIEMTDTPDLSQSFWCHVLPNSASTRATKRTSFKVAHRGWHTDHISACDKSLVCWHRWWTTTSTLSDI